MSELMLAIRLEGEGVETEAQVEKLEERINQSGVGEVSASASGLEETIVFVDMPPTCTEAELPAKMQALREILVGEGLDGIVEIPEDADDDWDDEEGDEDEGSSGPSTSSG